MTPEEHLQEALRLAREEGAREAREKLSRAILVGPFDDRGLARPGEENGPGYAIFIGEWRIGWWATRARASGEAAKLEHALQDWRPRR